MSATMQTERKYAMMRIAAGDYLLPSNDAKTIWRLVSMLEGPSTGIEGWARDRTVWSVWRWTDTQRMPYVDASSLDGWEMWDSMLATRAEAIEVALGARP